MRKWIAILTTWSAVLTLAAPAGAVVIFPKGGRAPIKAALVSQDSEKVVYRETLPDGSSVERVIHRVEIDDMIITVSEQRLASLTPDRPSGYRDYADELAEKREDPDARETAIRLYLIAAWLEPDRLGRSCLLGMAGLARTSDEQRKFLAMAYLLDPQHDRRLLKSADAGRRIATAATGALPDALMKPLVLLRQGKARLARAAATSAVQVLFRQIDDFLSYDQFIDACQQCSREGTIPPSVLRRILELELSQDGGARPDVAVSGPSGAPSGSWSETIQLGQVGPAASLDLLHVTEFDPRKCIYRDGEWKEN
jgi:hypothetical protein